MFVGLFGACGVCVIIVIVRAASASVLLEEGVCTENVPMFFIVQLKQHSF